MGLIADAGAFARIIPSGLPRVLRVILVVLLFQRVFLLDFFQILFWPKRHDDGLHGLCASVRFHQRAVDREVLPTDKPLLNALTNNLIEDLLIGPALLKTAVAVLRKRGVIRNFVLQ